MNATPKRRRNDHITIRGSLMVCRHCATQEDIQMPKPIHSVIRRIDDFITAHQDCPAPARILQLVQDANK